MLDEVSVQLVGSVGPVPTVHPLDHVTVRLVALQGNQQDSVVIQVAGRAGHIL